jgi:hypothetical protein
MYVGAHYVLMFILEKPMSAYDLVRLPLSLYFSWFYLRYLMVTESGVGDSSSHFALHTFFPQVY